eukprot:TRINITY_DN8113_c0_g1_i1.p1 TRINITY_DN8113_c0_g1~~TRINITY_DN8113_c0_g1_i1.p1  ORF type:complete len:191 (+),score=49.44 TRINITY_DN8113_c0_g1_i1:111-683(+)
MATLEQLREVVKEELESRGVLRGLRSQLRSEIFHALEDEADTTRPDPPPDNFLVNELIREYLAYNRMVHTASVFAAESGQPREPLVKDIVASELGVPLDQHARQLPLLYTIINTLKANKQPQPAAASASVVVSQPSAANKSREELAEEDLLESLVREQPVKLTQSRPRAAAAAPACSLRTLGEGGTVFGC